MLPPEIAELTNLRQLMLSGNQLTALPAEIAQLTKLGRLGLDGNQLTALPREVADLLSGGLELAIRSRNPSLSCMAKDRTPLPPIFVALSDPESAHWQDR